MRARRKAVLAHSAILYPSLVLTGVAGIWGPRVYEDPRPRITSILGVGIPISLSDMSLPQCLKTLGVWRPLVIWGSRYASYNSCPLW